MNMLELGVPGPSEWVLILVIVLVLFGAKKLPELARSLFKRSVVFDSFWAPGIHRYVNTNSSAAIGRTSKL
jgi:TatA/E family protein of Tat protein translocase